MTFALLLAFSALSATDSPTTKGGEPVDLKGTWYIVSITNGGKGTTSIVAGASLSISDKEVEWPKAIPPVFKGKGKATIKMDAEKKPPTFELKVGDKVYQGFYRAVVAAGGKEDALVMFISEPGGSYSREFMEKNPFKELKGFKGTRLAALRKRK